MEIDPILKEFRAGADKLYGEKLKEIIDKIEKE